MPIVFDLVEPRLLVEYTRQLTFPDFTLSQFLPDRNIRDIEYRFTKASMVDQDAAPFRAFDAEAAIGKRQGVARVSGELPPISKKMRLGEESRLRLEMLSSGDTAGLRDQLFNDADMMIRAVQARFELARGQALYDGRVIINENGVQATVDFGMPAGHRVTAATPWTDHAASTPLTNLRTWVQTYIDTNGFAPGRILTSTARISDLILNEELRNLAGVGATIPSILTPGQVGTILTANGLPPIEAYDTVVRLDGASTRVIPADRVIFLPPAGQPLGATFFGVTAEELELRAAGVQFGPGGEGGMVTVITKTDDPVATWTKAAAIGLPIVANADMLLTADVA